MKIIRTCAAVSTVVLLFIYAGLTLPVTAQRNAGIRMEVMARVLTDAGCPLTPVQLEQLKGIESGPGAREKVQAILTEEHKTALKNAAVGQRREGSPEPVSPLRFMARTLDKAGCPLTDAQKEQLKSIERGPGARDKVQAILTEEQKTALKNAAMGQRREGSPGPVSPLRFMARTLDKAGCPLSSEQKEQLKVIEPGPSAREQVKAILTPDQLKALEAHFNIEPTDKETLDESNKPAETEQQPESFNMLYQNYPNPFNPSTTIEYRLAENGPVTVEIFGLNGQLIETLVNGYQQAGQHTVTWDASSLAGGVYVCRITAGKYIESRKMTYVK